MKYNYVITRTKENAKRELNVYDCMTMINNYLEGKTDIEEVVETLEYLKERADVKD